MELLDAFITYRYPNGVSPGVYDILSSVPAVGEMAGLLSKAKNISPDQIWVNPTVVSRLGNGLGASALVNMVEAAKRFAPRRSRCQRR
jgi:5-methyltetrahydropteroyltriglutamate--homocysteine methyltransferase